MIKKSLLTTRYEPSRAITVNSSADKTACDVFSRPEAIGLLRLIGCFLSLSLSITSLMRYSPPDSRQKKTKARIKLVHIEGLDRLREKTIHTKTSEFLYHWTGRTDM